MKIKLQIPVEVQDIAVALEKAGFEAYVVGGCVRDMLLGKEPSDWDITTNALPEQIQEVFPDSLYENNFGTVAVKTRSEVEELKIVEITTYRVEGTYTDYRRPDEVHFAQTIEEDLSRRDFTVNAIALHAHKASRGEVDIIDPFGGEVDLQKKILRAVGDPGSRFEEDALRMMRGVRLACQLDFELEPDTYEALRNKAALLQNISQERIRDEFEKLIMTPRAGWGIELLRDSGLLQYVFPELLEMVGVDQNLHHIYTVWEHSKRALEYAASKNYSLEVRLAALLHDIGKPRTKGGEGKHATFYNHDMVGAKMVRAALTRLKFPKHVIQDVTHLVRYHMFYYNVGEISDAGVRRFISRVGVEYIDDLIKVREADRIGSGVPKAVPYKIRHLLFMIDKVRKDPISPKMLKVNGQDLMELGMKPGPRMGWILNVLLEEVVDDPQANVQEELLKRAQELNTLSDAELEALSKKARETKEEAQGEAEEEMKKKHFVK